MNYYWILGPLAANQRASRGLGFLIKREYYRYIKGCEFPTLNIGYLVLSFPQVDKQLYLVNVHKCNDNDPSSSIETGQLVTLIRQLNTEGNVLVLGDFNAHFGHADGNIIESESFGPILLHSNSNTNGEELALMCELLNLKVMTTICHKSTKITWVRGTQKSQIDHVLRPTNSTYVLSRLRGVWSKYNTDHKLLRFNAHLKINHPPEPEIPFLNNTFIFYHTTWRLQLLDRPAICNKFNDTINQCLTELRHPPSWTELVKIISYCATKVLRQRRPIRTPEQIQAFRDLQQALHQAMKPRLIDINSSYNDDDSDCPPLPAIGSFANVKTARTRLKNATPDPKYTALQKLLEDISANNCHPGERVHKAFLYLKGVRRQYIHNSVINHKQWQDDLQKSVGPEIPFLPDDGVPLPPAPTFTDVKYEINRLRNGKTPGLDRVYSEMLKQSTTLQYQLFRIIRDSYINNEFPSEWIETFSVPIPKIRKPQSINDYRKITMSSIGYKVCTRLLRTIIQPYLPTLDYYQNGFIANRSADDVVFTLRRIIEERYNHSRPTYIFNYDLRRAFDNVLEF